MPMYTEFILTFSFSVLPSDKAIVFHKTYLAELQITTAHLINRDFAMIYPDLINFKIAEDQRSSMVPSVPASVIQLYSNWSFEY